MACPRHLRIGIAILSVVAIGAIQAGLAVAAETVECGIIREYTAPDAGTSTAGSIAFGLTGPLETIAADATLVGATETNLGVLTGGTPTCVIATRTGVVITQLEFAASGTVAGTVAFVVDMFGPGQDVYVVDDRLIVPADLLATTSGLAALIKVPADSGTTTSLTFQIDTASGFPTGLDGTATISGPVVMLGNGDVTVGPSTLTTDLIDPASRTALQAASDLGADATVTIHGIGTIDITNDDGVVVAIELSVSLPAPSPSATPTPMPTPAAPVPPGALLPDTAMPR